MKRISKAVLIAVSIFMLVSGMTIKADENIKTIISWSFSDEGLIKENDTWYLHVKESSLEDIDTILPETIIAEFSDEEENISSEETTDDEIGSTDNTVDIAWESTDIDPSPASQVLYASLPSNYVLANSEEKIALTVIIEKDDPDIEEKPETIIDDETETVIEEEPITYSIANFDQLIINEPKPSGTVINLFDYWSEVRGTEQKKHIQRRSHIWHQ